MAEEQSPGTKKTRGLISKLLIVVVGVTGLAGAGWFFFSKKADAGTQQKASERPSVKAVLHLEGFVVNLADTDERTFLRVGIELGLSKEPEGAGGHGAKPALPTAQVRDAILSVLGTWKAADLLTPEGKAKLKEQIVSALGKSVPELSVREVYFTDFLVQR